MEKWREMSIKNPMRGYGREFKFVEGGEIWGAKTA